MSQASWLATAATVRRAPTSSCKETKRPWRPRHLPHSTLALAASLHFGLKFRLNHCRQQLNALQFMTARPLLRLRCICSNATADDGIGLGHSFRELFARQFRLKNAECKNAHSCREVVGGRCLLDPVALRIRGQECYEPFLARFIPGLAFLADFGWWHFRPSYGGRGTGRSHRVH